MENVVRVLQSVGSMDRGGQETFIMNVYRNIDRKKLQFDFLINSPNKCDYEDEIVSMGGIIHRIPRRFPHYTKHLRCLDKFLKNNKQYSTIHQHTSNNFAVSTIISAKKHKLKKIIYHSHCSRSEKSFMGEMFDFIYTPKIQRYATHYLACSDDSADYLFGGYIDKSKIKIINNGIDATKFAFNIERRDKKRKELNIEDKFVIGNIARFAESKNHTFIIDIFAQLHRNNSNAVLMLVGDGELRNAMEEKVETLGLKDNVMFTGVRADILDLLSAMDVFLLPSLFEGLPVTLIEAQASGLHCIASDTITSEAKITELLEYISLKESPSYWASKILSLAKYERNDMRNKIRRAGFDIKEVARKLEKFYLEGEKL
ncbi:MAG: glycosyltransferase family 1 protein [Treponema sp.]|nr:glycosyltransferase family 1 protein [Treponema sp.]